MGTFGAELSRHQMHDSIRQVMFSVEFQFSPEMQAENKITVVSENKSDFWITAPWAISVWNPQETILLYQIGLNKSSVEYSP